MARRFTGDWDKGERILNGFHSLAQKNLARATKLGSMRARDASVQMFVDSGPGWPVLLEATIARKGSSKPLIDHGDLMNSVVAMPLAATEAFVGVPRNAKNKDGDDLVNLGLVHIYGTEHIPARDFLTPVLEKMKPAQNELYTAAIAATLKGKTFRG